MAVEVRDTPPADLLTCPAAPEGFPEDADGRAVMPPAIRSAAIRLASAYADLRARLLRLVEWHRPGACADGR